MQNTDETPLTVSGASAILFRRYLAILRDTSFDDNPPCTGSVHLTWMCDTALSETEWTDDKISRWLGFIQGVMIMRGLLNVEEERDFSRPLFHQAYGKTIPSAERN